MIWCAKSYIQFLSICLLFSCGNAPVKISNESQVKFPVYCKDTLFNKAFIEIKAMLDGQIPLNFKRAVFLSEYAYCGNEINYEEFTRDIDSTVQILKDFIRQRKIEQYKTAGNFAIFEYMTKPCEMNGYKAYTYDFDDFYGYKDWRSTFVTKLMRTKKGNCRSLPCYYKILGNELNCNAHLAFAPNHVYIKHKGDQGEWINVELTNASFSRDEWIIESMGITPEAIENKIYMDPVTEKQAIASLLFDMATGYTVKYGEDEFALLCCNTILRHHPNNIQAILLKNNILVTIGNKLKKRNGKDPSPELKKNYEEFKNNLERINTLGYREMTKEEYTEWMRSVEKQKKLQNN